MRRRINWRQNKIKNEIESKNMRRKESKYRKLNRKEKKKGLRDKRCMLKIRNKGWTIKSNSKQDWPTMASGWSKEIFKYIYIYIYKMLIFFERKIMFILLKEFICCLWFPFAAAAGGGGRIISHAMWLSWFN